MKHPFKIIIPLLTVLLLAATGIAYFTLVPRVANVYPPDGTVNVYGNTPVQVTFSQEMRRDNPSQYLQFSPNTTGVYQVIGRTLVFTPSVPWEQDQDITVTLKPGIRSVPGLRLTGGFQWQFSTRHPWLLFLLQTDTSTDLYAVEPRGLTLEKLVTGGESVLDYAVGPDNSVYYSNPSGTGSQINRLDLLTRQTSVILPCKGVCSQLSIAVDGSRLAYQLSEVAGKKPAVYILSLSGNPAQSGPRLAAEAGHLTRDPDWSAAGWLAFYDETDRAFRFLQPVSGELASFANDTGEPGDWSADGRVYTAPDLSYTETASGNQPEYSSQLINYDPATGQQAPLTRDSRMEDLLPAYSPDGRQLVFARRFLNPQNWTPGRQIWAMNTDGSNIRPLTDSPVNNHLGFAWSPDGQLLAYLQFNTASLTGERQLLLMDMRDGTTQPVIKQAYNLQWLP